MTDLNIAVNALALYKRQPAKIIAVADKIEIQLHDAGSKRVRPKDIVLLHPGPVASLAALGGREGDLQSAWELLQGESPDFADLAELVYGEYTPETAWSSWELLDDGLYFSGTPEQIEVQDPDFVAAERERRERDRRERHEWDEFIACLEQSRLREQDRERLHEVEKVAHGKALHSKIMTQLGHQATPENAWRLLTQVGYWPAQYNPHPGRLDVDLTQPTAPLGELPDEPREDLTHLTALAIDDEGNEDPDDAISFDGECLWVHVADVAALVSPGSPADLEAASRGSNFYDPQRVIHMLPQQVTRQLGMGLNEVSPALSFRIFLDSAAVPHLRQISPSWVRVRRLTYQQAESQLTDSPLHAINQLADRYRLRRQMAQAVNIDLPEASLRVHDGEVTIRPLENLASRNLVTDLMLMAGEAIADYTQQRSIPIPYVMQPAPSEIMSPETLVDMYAYRRLMRPSSVGLEVQPHFGLGLPYYTRATSPLRRYSDLLVHQQLRASLSGADLLDEQAMAARLDQSNQGAMQIRKAERLSNLHWKLVYLQQRQDWRGEGIVVERVDGQKFTVLIPELAMETRVRLKRPPELGSRLTMTPSALDLAELSVNFRVRG